MTNQINKTPVLFVEPLTAPVTMENALNWAISEDFPEVVETEEARQIVAAVRSLIRNPEAATVKNRVQFAAYAATAAGILENLPETITSEKHEGVFERAASLLQGLACYLLYPEFSAGSGKPSLCIVKSILAPNDFKASDYFAVVMAMDEARKAFCALAEEYDQRENLSEDFTADEYEEAAALIGLIRAAMPLPCEVMAERGEYYADEDGGEA